MKLIRWAINHIIKEVGLDPYLYCYPSTTRTVIHYLSFLVSRMSLKVRFGSD